jgi:gamma-glutamyltranspeptidase
MTGADLEGFLEKLAVAGSRLAMSDFTAYQALDAEAVAFRYRGSKGWTVGRQGYGYPHAETLALFETYDFTKLDDADRWATMLLAQRVAFRDAKSGLGPDAPSLLGADHLAAQADIVRALAAGRADIAAWFPKARPGSGGGDTTHIVGGRRQRHGRLDHHLDRAALRLSPGRAGGLLNGAQLSDGQRTAAG